MLRYALAAIALLLLPTKTSEGSRAEPVELIPQGNSSFVIVCHLSSTLKSFQYAL
jgi:hypothetical protein